MVVNWREKKECGHDAKEGADMDSVHSAVPLKSVGLNLLLTRRNMPNMNSVEIGCLKVQKYPNELPK